MDPPEDQPAEADSLTPNISYHPWIGFGHSLTEGQMRELHLGLPAGVPVERFAKAWHKPVVLIRHFRKQVCSNLTQSHLPR